MSRTATAETEQEVGKRRYAAFDIETAKLLPDDVSDILSHRPLGVSCAAAYLGDSERARVWHGRDEAGNPTPQMSRDEVAVMVHDLVRLASDGYTLLTWNGLGFDFDILAEESGLATECADLAITHVDPLFHAVCTLGYPLSLPSLFGFIALAGIVVNDSILLIVFLKERRAQLTSEHGGSPEALARTTLDAAAQAGRLRFRAVILTSSTTIAGLTPLLFERSLQAQVLIPIVISTVFGSK